MKIKTIIAGVCAVVVVGAMFATASWASHRPKTTPCSWLKVEVTDSLDRQFVRPTELRELIFHAGLSPVGKEMDEVSCHAIEECVQQHEMIRTAECFKSPRGGVYLRVTQRVPALYVTGGEGNYYVDTDRKVMPVRASIDVEVPVFKGAVGKRAATEEYYDFALWLSQHTYWKSRIKQTHVHNAKHVVLHQNDGMGTILLGDLTDYVQKMNKLQKLYTKGFEKIGYKDYREYDLRYDGQVVGRY